MARKPLKVTSQLIQKARAEWYAHHYEKRQFFKALTAEEQRRYHTAAELLPPPTMTIFGGVPNDYPPREAFDAANRFGLDVDTLNAWYISDFGWQAFQDLWQQLPEPVDFLYPTACVQNGMVVPTIHSLDEIMPPDE